MRKADNLPPYCAIVKNSRSLNFLDPSGPAWPVTGVLYLYSTFSVASWTGVNNLHNFMVVCYLSVNCDLGKFILSRCTGDCVIVVNMIVI